LTDARFDRRRDAEIQALGRIAGAMRALSGIAVFGKFDMQDKQ
jgi:hypothetical protein